MAGFGETPGHGLVADPVRAAIQNSRSEGYIRQRGALSSRPGRSLDMKKEQELPEEAIEAAEEQPAAHGHGPFDDEALLEHLRSRHDLEAPDHLSRSTVEGLHDRLHDETDAAQD
ncbi:MAG: hypothetical protein LC792_21575 [Actinobacteria bacterium]|nr:hypothetical protein [Actinomycetota bacterium]